MSLKPKDRNSLSKRDLLDDFVTYKYDFVKHVWIQQDSSQEREELKKKIENSKAAKPESSNSQHNMNNVKLESLDYANKSTVSTHKIGRRAKPEPLDDFADDSKYSRGSTEYLFQKVRMEREKREKAEALSKSLNGYMPLVSAGYIDSEVKPLCESLTEPQNDIMSLVEMETIARKVMPERLNELHSDKMTAIDPSEILSQLKLELQDNGQNARNSIVNTDHIHSGQYLLEPQEDLIGKEHTDSIVTPTLSIEMENGFKSLAGTGHFASQVKLELQSKLQNAKISIVDNNHILSRGRYSSKPQDLLQSVNKSVLGKEQIDSIVTPKLLIESNGTKSPTRTEHFTSKVKLEPQDKLQNETNSVVGTDDIFDKGWLKPQDVFQNMDKSVLGKEQIGSEVTPESSIKSQNDIMFLAGTEHIESKVKLEPQDELQSMDQSVLDKDHILNKGHSLELQDESQSVNKSVFDIGHDSSKVSAKPLKELRGGSNSVISNGYIVSNVKSEPLSELQDANKSISATESVVIKKRSHSPIRFPSQSESSGGSKCSGVTETVQKAIKKEKQQEDFIVSTENEDRVVFAGLGSFQRRKLEIEQRVICNRLPLQDKDENVRTKTESIDWKRLASGNTRRQGNVSHFNSSSRRHNELPSIRDPERFSHSSNNLRQNNAHGHMNGSGANYDCTQKFGKNGNSHVKNNEQGSSRSYWNRNKQNNQADLAERPGSRQSYRGNRWRDADYEPQKSQNGSSSKHRDHKRRRENSWDERPEVSKKKFTRYN